MVRNETPTLACTCRLSGFFFAAEPARQFRLQFRDFQTHARILNRLIDGAAAASRPESLSLWLGRVGRPEAICAVTRSFETTTFYV